MSLEASAVRRPPSERRPARPDKPLWQKTAAHCCCVPVGRAGGRSRRRILVGRLLILRPPFSLALPGAATSASLSDAARRPKELMRPPAAARLQNGPPSRLGAINLESRPQETALEARRHELISPKPAAFKWPVLYHVHSPLESVPAGRPRSGGTKQSRGRAPPSGLAGARSSNQFCYATHTHTRHTCRRAGFVFIAGPLPNGSRRALLIDRPAGLARPSTWRAPCSKGLAGPLAWCSH